MGRNSRFGFLSPGRRHPDTVKEEALPSTPTSISKAQRFFGIGADLNIVTFSRTADDSSSAPGDGFSLTDTGPLEPLKFETLAEDGASSSEALPSGRRGVAGKPSPPFLAQGGDLESERSPAELASHYEHQNPPPSRSQHGSTSSHDLTLQPGHPILIPRSRLQEVDSFVEEQFDKQFSKNMAEFEENEHQVEATKKRKPAKLDFSMLFSGHARGTESSPRRQSLGTSSSKPVKDTGRWNLKKVLSRESVNPQKSGGHLLDSPDLIVHKQKSQQSLHQLYDHYEQMPFRSPHAMDKIPESRVPSEVAETHAGQGLGLPPLSKLPLGDRIITSIDDQPPWDTTQHNTEPPSVPWKSTGAISVSSQRSKNSKRSAFSNIDLRKESVLSLSSDSEESGDESAATSPPVKTLQQNDRTLRVLNGGSADSIRSSIVSEDSPAPPRTVSRKSPRKERVSRHSNDAIGGQRKERKGSMKATPFLTIPEFSTSTTAPFEPRTTTSHSIMSRKSSLQSVSSMRSASSIGSRRSSQALTPPLSSSSIDFRQSSATSSRFMAVSRQEEALLESLRSKAARKKKKRPSKEDESTQGPSPPRTQSLSRKNSATPSIAPSTTPSTATGKQTIHLYLDTPSLHRYPPIPTAEPSPDLSDFLTFESDAEDAIPRTNWPYRPTTERPGTNNTLLTSHAIPPRTPPTTNARLSAVGAQSDFANLRSAKSPTAERASSMKFMEGAMLADEPFLVDEERESVWGM